jgi:prefoldin subunit 5
MRQYPHAKPTTAQEKQELLEEVAQLEELAASIRERMRRLTREKGETQTVTSITARLKKLDIPDK